MSHKSVDLWHGAPTEKWRCRAVLGLSNDKISQILFLMGLTSEPARSLGRGLFMSINRLFASFLLSVAMLFSLASTASATTYTYAGNSFTLRSGTALHFATALNLSFTLSTTLAANLTDFDVLPFVTAFSWSDGVRTITEKTIFSFAEFRVATDASGNISLWTAQFDWNAGDDSSASCFDPGNTLLGTTGDCGNIPSPNGDDTFTGLIFGPVSWATTTLGDPGVWTTFPVPVPAPSLGPLGMAILLSLLGLAGLRSRSRAKHA